MDNKEMTIQMTFTPEDLEWLRSKFELHDKEDLCMAVWECITTFMEL